MNIDNLLIEREVIMPQNDNSEEFAQVIRELAELRIQVEELQSMPAIESSSILRKTFRDGSAQDPSGD